MRELCPVDIGSLAAWITSIGFEDWPQQRPLGDGQLRPSMVTDLQWHEFGAMTDSVVAQLMTRYPGYKDDQRMLSVVMPGHDIPRHIDQQPSHWLCRIHVPLTSNDLSFFTVGTIEYSMEPGMAYEIDTRVEHAIFNHGRTPRIHFMFDVKKQP